MPAVKRVESQAATMTQRVARVAFKRPHLDFDRGLCHRPRLCSRNENLKDIVNIFFCFKKGQSYDDVICDMIDLPHPSYQLSHLFQTRSLSRTSFHVLHRVHGVHLYMKNQRDLIWSSLKSDFNDLLEGGKAAINSCKIGSSDLCQTRLVLRPTLPPKLNERWNQSGTASAQMPPGNWLLQTWKSSILWRWKKLGALRYWQKLRLFSFKLYTRPYEGVFFRWLTHTVVILE